tara:strand:+ start:437 stop:718 length:282 start_codon:yes stop_codon:yes gene_type:complete
MVIDPEQLRLDLITQRHVLKLAEHGEYKEAKRILDRLYEGNFKNYLDLLSEQHRTTDQEMRSLNDTLIKKIRLVLDYSANMSSHLHEKILEEE